MLEKILICLDGSRLAEQILPLAIESCQHSKSKAVLLQVVTSEITLSAPQSIHIPPMGGKIDSKTIPVSEIAGEYTMETGVGSQLAEIEKEQDENKRYLERLAFPLRKQGMKVTTVLLQGEPGETIIKWAEKHGITLIALTSHGHGGLELSGYERDSPKVLKSGLGRVAQQVLKSSALPLLIIKPVPVQGK
jgi:nucleotide-binding universal stress UspA family protein